MYIILLKEEFLYNFRKVKNTVNISQTAEEISKHYKDIWKGNLYPLISNRFQLYYNIFFLTVSMFLGEVIYDLVIIHNHF